MRKQFFICMSIVTSCFSGTATGPCLDPVCDSINYVTILRKLGYPNPDSDYYYKGNRIDILGICCNIDTFPEEIGNLTELKRLTLGSGRLELTNCSLKHLPTSIGNLTKLQFLDLSNNQLEELPPEIGRLVNLRELYLQRNNLTTLPDSIVNITKLDYYLDVSGRMLDIRKNRICTLPPAVESWVDKMVTGRHDDVYVGGWEISQCSGFCPKGQESCGTPVKIPRTIPVHKPQPLETGMLFDLQGKRVAIVNRTGSFSGIPKGCYIAGPGTGMVRKLTIVIR